jgi:hypothetical protein
MHELAKWDGFYVIVGSAAGALIGLQFVVMTLIAERPAPRAGDAGAAFGTPTIVHFSAVLLLSALLHAPWPTITPAAVLCGLIGLGGAAYVIVVARRMRRQERLPTGVRRLAVSSVAAAFGILDARAVLLCGCLSHARGAVWRRRHGAVIAVHRHPQRLGRRHLPRLCHQAENKLRAARRPDFR